MCFFHWLSFISDLSFSGILLINPYGNICVTVSSRPARIGIDIEIITTFPPISIFVAIADSPASLQILTANSVKNAIPVIFNKSTKKLLLIEAVLTKEFSISIMAEILGRMQANIKIPAIKEIYTVNSGLYWRITIINSNATNPIPIIFTMSMVTTSLSKL